MNSGIATSPRRGKLISPSPAPPALETALVAPQGKTKDVQDWLTLYSPSFRLSESSLGGSGLRVQTPLGRHVILSFNQRVDAPSPCKQGDLLGTGGRPVAQANFPSTILWEQPPPPRAPPRPRHPPHSHSPAAARVWGGDQLSSLATCEVEVWMGCSLWPHSNTYPKL